MDEPHDVTPTGIAPLVDVFVAPSNVPQLFLEFEATQAEPAVEKIFLGAGGSIASAAARGETDFALSGSRTATVSTLSDRYATVVRISVPGDMVSPNAQRELTVDIDHRAKLLINGSRAGASINGSLVTTVAGQGAAYLSKIFRSSTGHSQIPLTYASWQAHTAVVGASNLRIVDGDGRRYNLNFTKNPERDVALQHAEEFVGKWAEMAWANRQESLRYESSPTLTKAVCKVPCGINDSGYDLVHNVVEMQTPFSYNTINSLLENAMQADLEFIPEDIAKFMGDTTTPGKTAAAWGRTLAASLSTIANVLVSYRADGRTSVLPDGPVAVAAESWLQQAPRTPYEGNDCDGSAILVSSLARAISNAPAKVLANHEYINAARNMLVPHYTVGVSVLGASGAEASGMNRSHRTPHLAAL